LHLRRERNAEGCARAEGAGKGVLVLQFVGYLPTFEVN
jgi:hypothetical protein